RDEPQELTELEAGRLVHRALERFHTDLRRAPGGWRGATPSDGAARGQSALDTVCGGVGAGGRTRAPPPWEGRKAGVRGAGGQRARGETSRRGALPPSREISNCASDAGSRSRRKWSCRTARA